MESEGSLTCYKSPPPIPILSERNPIHTLQPYFPKISILRRYNPEESHLRAHRRENLKSYKENEGCEGD
jgi:hypothetical protein